MRKTIRSGVIFAVAVMKLLGVFVIAILVLLVFIAPRTDAPKGRARLVKTRTDVVSIAMAWTKYYEHYKRWPRGAGVWKMDSSLTAVLLGNGTNDNPDLIPFYDAQVISTNSSGMVNDWGNAIYVQFDDDFDNKIVVSHDDLNDTVEKSAVCFTQGSNDQQKVWITSW